MSLFWQEVGSERARGRLRSNRGRFKTKALPHPSSLEEGGFAYHFSWGFPFLMDASFLLFSLCLFFLLFRYLCFYVLYALFIAFFLGIFAFLFYISLFFCHFAVSFVFSGFFAQKGPEEGSEVGSKPRPCHTPAHWRKVVLLIIFLGVPFPHGCFFSFVFPLPFFPFVSVSLLLCSICPFYCFFFGYLCFSVLYISFLLPFCCFFCIFGFLCSERARGRLRSNRGRFKTKALPHPSSLEEGGFAYHFSWGFPFLMDASFLLFSLCLFFLLFRYLCFYVTIFP